MTPADMRRAAVYLRAFAMDLKASTIVPRARTWPDGCEQEHAEYDELIDLAAKLSAEARQARRTHDAASAKERA